MNTWKRKLYFILLSGAIAQAAVAQFWDSGRARSFGDCAECSRAAVKSQPLAMSSTDASNSAFNSLKELVGKDLSKPDDKGAFTGFGVAHGFSGPAQAWNAPSAIFSTVPQPSNNPYSLMGMPYTAPTTMDPYAGQGLQLGVKTWNNQVPNSNWNLQMPYTSMISGPAPTYFSPAMGGWGGGLWL